jgi:formylmethanofuran dehydrogenase subunit E
VQKGFEQKELDSAMGEAVRLHGHLGPFLVIGARMGHIAKNLLKSQTKRGVILNATIRVPVVVPFSCAIDGIQVTTHCTVGNQRLLLKRWMGGVRGSFTVRGSGKVVDIQVRRRVIGYLKKRMSEGATNEELAEEILQLPEDKLFVVSSCEAFLHQLKNEETKRDFRIAKNRLTNRNLTLCIVKGGKILFESRSHGVTSFLTAVQEYKGNLEKSCVADKIVGKAVALLCVHFKIGAVFAETLSRPAKTMFERCSFCFEYGHLVENVLDQQKMSLCPFERLVRNVTDPGDAYEKLVNYGSVRGSKPLRMRGR